jgi:outer membrane receptor for ferrienterochelin and colicin
MRVDLARSILEDREIVAFDEFTSVVNREVAKTGSYAISKAVRKMNKKFIGLSVFTLATTFAYAQEFDTLKVNNLKEVVVSDTKFAQSKEKSGKIIEVITAEDLANKQGQSLLNVLSQVAGVEVNGNQLYEKNDVNSQSCVRKFVEHIC